MNANDWIWVCVGLLVWIFFGAAVLAGIDDDEQRLYHWYASAPSPWLKALVLLLWPVVALTQWWGRGSR